jgi:hypothetical protein
MTALLGLCLLLGVVVESGDCQAAQAYAPHVARLPDSHWRLVASVRLTERSHGSAEYSTRRIVLPEIARLYFVAHETAHLVFLADGGRLQRRWNADLWDGGRPLGDLLDYPAEVWLTRGASRARLEDAAESYAYHLLGRDVGKRRQAWLREHLPGLGRRTGQGAS